MGLSDSEPADALAGSEWNAGYIISDALFYQADAMSAPAIQSFLDGKVGRCSNGACLNVLRFDVGAKPEVRASNTGALRCGALPGGNFSAAEYIYQVQVSCGISAKVILVTLQKEQGLVTKNGPSQAALDRAMGMNCPDTAPCAPSSLGFANQVYQGTMQLNTYRAARFAIQPGVRAMQYHPNAGCGRATVNIQNYATAALYSYTPYTPNGAALANLSGTGDGCSSYGNRNFWVYYNSWFGSTLGRLPKLVANASLGEPSLYSLARDNAGQLRGYPQTGSGGWAAPGAVGIEWDSMSALTIGGDFDGDGRADVMARDPFGRLWFYDRDGSGGWQDAGVLIGSGWNQFTFIVGGQDFTGDGRPDVITVDTSGLLILYPGDGTGGFRAPAVVGSGWSDFDDVIVARGLFGAGEADVVGRRGDGSIVAFGSDNKGGWSRSSTLATGWGAYRFIQAAGDFDSDGRQDVFAVDDSGALWLYPGSASGGFGARRAVGSGWNTMSALLAPVDNRRPVGTPAVDGARAGAGDLNGDSRPDLLARDGLGNLTDYPADGQGKWLAPRSLPGGFADMKWFAGVGDFDQNGSRDFVGIDQAGRLILYPGLTDNGWRTRRIIGLGWLSATAVVAPGDFDGDGIPDLIARFGDGRLTLYPGDGRGGWKAPRDIGSGWQTFSAIFAAGDWTGDGRPDLMARRPDGTLVVYPGDGSGGWLASSQVGSGWQEFGSFVGGTDWNSDGTSDVLTVAPDGALWLYPGDGRGLWGLPRQVGTGWSGFAQLG